MKKLIYLSNLLSVISITLLCIFVYLVNGTHITTINLFLGLFVLIDINISNLYKLTKKYINNAIYNILNIVVCLYSIYIMLNSYFLYFYYFKLNDLNSASLYFYNNIFKIMIAFILLFLISFIFKKEVVKTSSNNTKSIYVLLAVLSILPILNFDFSILGIISLALCIFYIIMILKISKINTKKDLQKLYFILILISIILSNFIGVVLLFNLYINLDRVGLNI